MSFSCERNVHLVHGKLPPRGLSRNSVARIPVTDHTDMTLAVDCAPELKFQLSNQHHQALKLPPVKLYSTSEIITRLLGW